jgi:hypothetical protein
VNAAEGATRSETLRQKNGKLETEFLMVSGERLDTPI